ncbi:MAG: hypothetical protein AAGF25_01435 [Pseudomonadota bacterium]
MNAIRVALLAGAVCAPISGNLAHAADMEFNSTVLSTCGIVVTRDGELAPRQNARILTSGGAGAQHGLATVTANSNLFQLHVDQPTDFDVRPAADTAPEQDFRARIRSNGATTFGWTRNSQDLNAGSHNVRIQFRARKAPGVSFANGFYSATVVIRCE